MAIAEPPVRQLRRTRPDLECPFRVPLVPVFPIMGVALCIYLMTQLSGATWWRFGIWLLIGLVIYASTDSATRGCGAAT
jgi:basic amino acid/polyamine antiporter, APA family